MMLALHPKIKGMWATIQTIVLCVWKLQVDWRYVGSTGTGNVMCNVRDQRELYIVECLFRVGVPW